MGEMPILSGMVFCAAYRKKGKHLCPSHQIRNTVIEEQLLEGIRSIMAYVREHEDEFVRMVAKKSQEELSRSLRDSKREPEQTQARIRKLEISSSGSTRTTSRARSPTSGSAG